MHKRWTKEEVELLKKLHFEKFSIAEIAKILEKSNKAISQKLIHQKLSKKLKKLPLLDNNLIKEIIDFYKIVKSIPKTLKKYPISAYHLRKILKENSVVIFKPLPKILNNGLIKCCHCQTYKSIENFGKNKKNCKICNRLIAKKHSQKNKKTRQEYYYKNLNYYKKYRNNYNKKRKENDELFKFSAAIRSNIIYCFKRKYFGNKNCKTEQILGCSFKEFKNYIESKFEPWMNWDNYGNKKGYSKEINISWDLDHIIPVSFAKNNEELIKLNHYTNFQPLCSYINRYLKRNKI
jgi:hypothetical protein